MTRAKVAQRAGLPLNVVLKVTNADGPRHVVIKRGAGNWMVVRQKTGAPLREGDLLATEIGSIRLEVVSRTKKDLRLKILGRPGTDESAGTSHSIDGNLPGDPAGSSSEG